MTNPTSQEWSRVLSDARTELEEASEFRKNILADLAQAKQEIATLTRKHETDVFRAEKNLISAQASLRSAETLRLDSGQISALRFEVSRQQQIVNSVRDSLKQDPNYIQAQQRFGALSNAEGLADFRVFEATQTLDNATRQRDIALGAVPGTEANPPPASALPGSNTASDPKNSSILPQNQQPVTPTTGTPSEPVQPPPISYDRLPNESLDDYLTRMNAASDATIAQYQQARSNLDEILKRNGIAVPGTPDSETPTARKVVLPTPQQTTQEAEVTVTPVPEPNVVTAPLDATASNYQGQPIVIGDAQKFTASATAANIDLAQELALEQARTEAYNKFGVGQTEFVSFDQVRVKFNEDGTYTAKYDVNAVPTMLQDDEPFKAIISDPPVPDGVTDASLGELGINTDLPSDAALGELGINTALPAGTIGGPWQGALNRTRTEPVNTTSNTSSAKKDWRVRLSLGPAANYLYAAEKPGILGPLRDTGGVLFPYTPTIGVTYSAGYDPTEIVHTNYRFPQYRSSSVDSISISCDFTAQDADEANYLLATIHFFRSVTKMFYGQDSAKSGGVKSGTPPPLCFLTGMGEFQFNQHPLLITSFTMNLPNDVDYIRTDSTLYLPGMNTAPSNTQRGTSASTAASRRSGSGLGRGAERPQPAFATAVDPHERITYVPTKMTIAVAAIPVVSRYDVSKNFSLTDYASGDLLRGKTNGRTRTGGMW